MKRPSSSPAAAHRSSTSRLRCHAKSVAPTLRLLQVVDDLKPYAHLNREAQTRAWNRVQTAVWGKKESKFDVRRRFFELVDQRNAGSSVTGSSGDGKCTLVSKLVEDVKRYERIGCLSSSQRSKEEEAEAEEARVTRATTRKHQCSDAEEDENSTNAPARGRQKTAKGLVATKTRKRSSSAIDLASDGLFIDLVVMLQPHLTPDSAQSDVRWARISQQLLTQDWPRSLKTRILKIRFTFLQRVLQSPDYNEHQRLLTGVMRAKLEKYCARVKQQQECDQQRSTAEELVQDHGEQEDSNIEIESIENLLADQHLTTEEEIKTSEVAT